MQYCLVVPASRFLIRAAIAAVALLLAALGASAGRQAIAAAGPYQDSEIERVRDEQRREMQLRSGGRKATAGPTDERAVKIAVKQLNEDFKRIQVIRNDVAHAVVVGGTLDYARISDEVAELKKRAQRMQTYLALQRGASALDEKGRAGEAELDEGRMKEALVRLCRRIDSFVANPKFKSPGVVDVEGTAKAGRDLQEIITLSNAVRSSAGRLGQGSASIKHAGP
ncbi:MAG: hypothetical protein QOC99_820 [Acidobacteriota bacterium]|nr:hypothetical protein [Acidobacteriota bacterium]MDT7778308.1 hypothetical protein [Acidobacteriota bacterium]